MASCSDPYPVPTVGHHRRGFLKQAGLYQLAFSCLGIVAYQSFGRSQPKDSVAVHTCVVDDVFSPINCLETLIRRVVHTNIRSEEHTSETPVTPISRMPSS